MKLKNAVIEYEILNWEKYNPRTDVKQVSWFRVDAEMVSSADCARMEDKVFRIWVALLSRACRGRGKTRLALSTLAHTTRTSLSRALVATQWLQDAGMINCDLKLLSELRPLRTVRNERNETRRDETEKPIASAAILETAEPSPPSQLDFRPKQLFEIWNANCGSLSKASRLTDPRRQKIKSRLTEEPDLEYWRAVIQRMAKSTFCVEGKWATFDWLIENGNNHVKVSEGKYDNSKANTPFHQLSVEEQAKLEGMVVE